MIVALVPAAGQSRRMGRPKLTLELGGQTVIARVVHALLGGGADQVLVITAADDQPGTLLLRDEAARAGALVLKLPTETPDMRSTIEHGLTAIPAPPLGILIAPGDSAGMTPQHVNAVVSAFQADPSRIVVPRRQGAAGHPLALPWSIAATLSGLPAHVGVNAIVTRDSDRVLFVEVVQPGHDMDLDTPADFERLRQNLE